MGLDEFLFRSEMDSMVLGLFKFGLNSKFTLGPVLDFGSQCIHILSLPIVSIESILSHCRILTLILSMKGNRKVFV